MDLWSISERLRDALDALHFAPPVVCTYNPLVYAAAPMRAYAERFGSGHKEALLLGMNPGPFGMAQTGVPFGAVPFVRDWLGIDAPVEQPARAHPKRPIEGFACKRVEVSGQRLWGWAKQRFDAPENFFAKFFVYNYCPLAFMEEGGKNRTPDKLPQEERQALFAACDAALRDVVCLLQPRLVIGIGTFAESRAVEALAGTDVSVGRILHPSPQSPLANRGWAAVAESQLAGLGVQF